MIASLRSVLPKASAPAPAPAVNAGAQKQGLALLDDITCGTHYAALNTAAVGSGFNALCAKLPLQRATSLRNFIPNPPSARLSWGRLMQEMGQPDSVSLSVSTFLTHLAVVEKQVEFICGEIEQRGEPAAIAQHTGRMQQATRQMSQLAIAALGGLEVAASAVGSTHFARNGVLLRGLLYDVGEGRAPLVDRAGRMQVPELPQRRVPMRKRVSMPCVVECKGKEHRAVVTNISAGGAGLENVPGLTARSTVVVEIGERCMSGRIVWQSGKSAGIRFDRPLKEDDPLLAD